MKVNCKDHKIQMLRKIGISLVLTALSKLVIPVFTTGHLGNTFGSYCSRTICPSQKVF